MRCSTSVGHCTLGSSSRTSTCEFIRIRSRAPAGLSAGATAPLEPRGQCTRRRWAPSWRRRRSRPTSARAPRRSTRAPPRGRPRVVLVGVGPLRVGPVEDERAGPARDRSRRRGRPSGRPPSSRTAPPRLAARRVHHRAHVVHARLEVGQPDAAVGEPGPALVEADQPCERAQALEEACVLRVLPVDLEVGEEPRDEHEVERPVAGHLVGDVDVPAARVPDRAAHARSFARRSHWPTVHLPAAAGGRLRRP